jgi:hypothetical protein
MNFTVPVLLRFRSRHPGPGHSPQLPAPASSSAATRGTPAAACSAAALRATATVSRQALLAARAVGAGIASLAVIAKCIIAGAAGSLPTVTTLGLPLVLIKVWLIAAALP